MAKIVKVKFLNVHNHRVHRFLTPSKCYHAFTPTTGQYDPYGDRVRLDGEMWIASDDKGNVLVTNLDDDWELVETL